MEDKYIDDLSTKIEFLGKKIGEYNEREDVLLNVRVKLVKIIKEGIIDSGGEFKILNSERVSYW